MRGARNEGGKPSFLNPLGLMIVQGRKNTHNKTLRGLFETGEMPMKGNTSGACRAAAENCAERADSARDEPTRKRFKRMEAAWLALAAEQDWLDGNDLPEAYRSALGEEVRNCRGTTAHT
jgi:hypothetical protein